MAEWELVLAEVWVIGWMGFFVVWLVASFLLDHHGLEDHWNMLSLTLFWPLTVPVTIILAIFAIRWSREEERKRRLRNRANIWVSAHDTV